LLTFGSRDSPFFPESFRLALLPTSRGVRPDIAAANGKMTPGTRLVHCMKPRSGGKD
jgi:hypothetical protein